MKINIQNFTHNWVEQSVQKSSAFSLFPSLLHAEDVHLQYS